MIDQVLLQQTEATQNQYIFNFVLLNVILLLGLVYKDNRKIVAVTWLLIVVFCLYAYWDTDYFTFRQIFHSIDLKDFRDPLYYYVGKVSFGSYTIFRLYIWGVSTLLFYKTIKRFELNINYTILIFSVLFLLNFSYARASLGMALYFYGVSIILRPQTNNHFKSILLGLLFIIGSYWGHRSMSLLIFLSPFLLIKMDKKNMLFFAVLALAITTLVPVLLADLVDGGIALNGELSAVEEAARSYASNDTIMEYNWRYKLMQNLNHYSFITLMIYALWKIVVSKSAQLVDPLMKQILSLLFSIFMVAISFMNISGRGTEVIGYRYLYMLGIPLCIVMSYLVNRGLTKPRTLFVLLIPSLLYAEGFLLGKIWSFQ